MGNLAHTAKSVLLRGNRFYCPLCTHGYRRFLDGGVARRPNARCPGCGSLERHRLLAALIGRLRASGDLAIRGRVLHVAPESALARVFSKGTDYLSVDLDGSQAMQAMDVTDLDLADESIDIVVCNHVLEHVPDDRRAMREFYRVMKPGGWGSIQVPMAGDVTQEDLAITDPEERRRLYGQEDHVRQYGHDFPHRLQEAGFHVTEYRKKDWFTAEELARLSVASEVSVILARRPG